MPYERASVTQGTLAAAQKILERMVDRDIDVTRPLQFFVAPDGRVFVVLLQGARIASHSFIDDGISSAAKFVNALEQRLDTNLPDLQRSDAVAVTEGVIGRKLSLAERVKLNQLVARGETATEALDSMGGNISVLTAAQAKEISDGLKGRPGEGWLLERIYRRVADALARAVPDEELARDYLPTGDSSGLSCTSTGYYFDLTQMRALEQIRNDVAKLVLGGANGVNWALAELCRLVPNPRDKRADHDLVPGLSDLLARLREVFGLKPDAPVKLTLTDDPGARWTDGLEINIRRIRDVTEEGGPAAEE
jgi:hypothetical protein